MAINQALPALFTSLTIMAYFPATCQVARDSIGHYRPPENMNDGITVSSLDKEGIDSGKVMALVNLMRADSFKNIHGLLIARNNFLVCEYYFPGNDEIWGFKMPDAKHTSSTLHDARSISKSVVSACIGIALMQHRLKSIDDPIFEYLPGYAQYKNAGNEKITVRHLLTMSSGIRWNEEMSYADAVNDEGRMERSRDPVAFVLQLPLDHQPGSQWNYNSGGVQVLAAIIKQVSGLDIDKFAEQYLFAPLGIKTYQWIKSSPGFPAAASGLRLRPRDMLKFGLLYLNGGVWDRQRVLAADWVKQSIKTQILRTAGSKTRGYGFLFWTYRDTTGEKSYDISEAVGNGGQRIFINQPNKLVVVITAGNYNNFSLIKNGEYALRQFIMPALKD